MNKVIKKSDAKYRRKDRIRKKTRGTTERPRLTVTVSNAHISAQIIDDQKGTTIVSASTVGNSKVSGTMTEKAKLVGQEIAKKAKAAKISKVVFDRNGRLYHGRIKALADAVREGGVEF